jgi:hypothetical protein
VEPATILQESRPYLYLFITKHEKMQGLDFTKKCPLLRIFCPGLTSAGFRVISTAKAQKFLAYFLRRG